MLESYYDSKNDTHKNDMKQANLQLCHQYWIGSIFYNFVPTVS